MHYYIAALSRPRMQMLILRCCNIVQDNRASEKLEDISSAVEQVVQDKCVCSWSEVDSELFRCFEGSDDSVTWRARLLATSEVEEDRLFSVLEDWVSGGGSMVVGGVALSLVPQCSRQIDQLLQDQDGCKGSEGGVSAGSSAGAVAGGIVSALVVVVAITAVVIAALILWKRR